MEQTFTFQKLPDRDELDAAIYLQPPFAVEVRQGQKQALGIGFYEYHEFADCASVAELHDFLSCPENGVAPAPFYLSIEEIRDDDDHPSLSAAERNPSLASR